MSTTIDFGIDLGTTNSAIARYEKGDVVVFKNPVNLKETLSSVVAFKNERTIVGDKARELLQKSNNNVFGLFKRKMGTAETYVVESSSRMVTPIDLSAMVLKELKHFIHDGTAVDSVVITIPSAFDTVQSNATKKAGYQAGFFEVVLLQEPIAASLAYANKADLDISDGKWLVYDLGGGTFDVALTAIADGELKIVDHEGDNYLGGTDFDNAIIDGFIIPNLENKGTFANLETELKKASGKYNRLYYKLLFLAEEAKKVLTNSAVAEIEFEVTDDSGEEIEVFLELSKDEFEKLIEPYIEKTIKLIDLIISRNKLSKEDLKCILLIGGSTYMPLVRNTLNTKYGVEINTSLDPTTAVVIGAAYYAGLKRKSKKENNSTTAQGSANPIDRYKLAYEQVSREVEALLLVVTEESVEGLTYRITRTDGGYDSGVLDMQKKMTINLPLVKDTLNAFVFKVLDKSGTAISQEGIGIMQGKFSIDGQPLPNNICLEVDAVENETTFLEPIFKKNDILPLRKTITKQVSKTIHKGSSEEIVIKVFEGDIDSIPAANKLIGMISVNGQTLERDLIKGSDVELTLEITESRDLKVGAYFTLTDQEVENTFSPSENSITKNVLLAELKAFEQNLSGKLKGLERSGKFEQAAIVVKVNKEIKELMEAANTVSEDTVSDDFYILDVKKREIGKRIQEVFSTSLLTKVIEEYYEAKGSTGYFVEDQQAEPSDKKEYEDLIAQEIKFLQEGNVTTIKMKINHMQSISRRIGRRTPTTPEDIMMHYVFLKNYNFKERGKAAELIDRGDRAMEANNLIDLVKVIEDLMRMKDREGNDGLFKNEGTGLK
ncbi:MAG: molecular chaperone DnaK [Flavobacteriales bacterium]|jgi:molecular chaperone DnaK